MRYQPDIVYLGLGSNQGDSLQLIHKALERINRLAGSKIIACSHIYRSKALTQKNTAQGITRSPIAVQPDYYNAVCKLITYLPALQLLSSLQKIEEILGRLRVQPELWGLPRTIDIDVLLFGQRTISSRQLNVPHPAMTERSFVILPLAEIEPQLILPDGTHIETYVGNFKAQSLRPIAKVSIAPDGSSRLQSPKLDRTQNAGNVVISFI